MFLYPHLAHLIIKTSMNSNRSTSFLFVGGLIGGVLGFASFLWLLTVRPAEEASASFWQVIAVVFVSAIAAVGGGMIGVAIERISRDISSGGSLRPYLTASVQYLAITLFVLLIRGNRDPLDLLFLPSLSAIAGLVLFSLVGTRSRLVTS